MTGYEFCAIIHSRAFRIKKNAKNQSKFRDYYIKEIAEGGILAVNMVIHIYISLWLQTSARKKMLQILVVRWK